jgi:hypothetical protein
MRASLSSAYVALTLTAVLLAPAAPALAQPAPPAADAAVDPKEQQAQQLFLEGREAIKKGQLPVAAEKFQQSLDLHATPGTLLNLATVEEEMGKLVKALGHFEAALQGLPENDERRALAAQGADRLRPRIPLLRVDRAAGTSPDMSIRIDGTPIAASSIGNYVKFDPGSYVVTTSTPGHQDRRYELKMSEGKDATLAVEPGPLLVPEQAPEQPRPTGARPSRMQVIGAGALGVGVAGLGVGAVAGVLAIVQKGDASSACPDATRCTSRAGLDAAASGQTLASVSTAAFAVGLAGAAAGVALVVAGRERPARAPAALAGVSFGASPLPGGAVFGARGSF